jgi:hypothetical protein
MPKTTPTPGWRDDAVSFSTNDIEMLQQLSSMLPDGWECDNDTESLRWCRFRGKRPADDKRPQIVVYRTSTHYQIAVCSDRDSSSDDDMLADPLEAFSVDDIEIATTNVRHLLCEVMQTEDPSERTPAFWMTCIVCSDTVKERCHWGSPKIAKRR